MFPDDITLLHNPRCTKSRGAKALLEERGMPFRERRYLEEPLSLAELRELAKRLGVAARDWVRKGEAEYKTANLGPDSDDEAILHAMARYPVLMERPILIRGPHAIVGRPPERITELL